MRPVLVLVWLSAGFAAAQTKPPQEAPALESYPVWWDAKLGLSKLADAEARFSEPFSKNDLDSLGTYGHGLDGPPPEVRDCEQLLALKSSDGADSPKREGSWGEIGSRCAELRALSHAIPARQSAVRGPVWTPGVVSLLPAGIFAAPGDDDRRAALSADGKGLSLRQFWEQMAPARSRENRKRWEGIAFGHYFEFGLEKFSLGDEIADNSPSGFRPYCADVYQVVARGDFLGDGWEDLLVETAWEFYRGPYRTYAAYVLTRRSASGRFEIVKQVF